MEYGIISILAGALVVFFAYAKTQAMLKRGKRNIDMENLAWEEYKKNVALSELMRNEAYIELERSEDRRRFQDEYMEAKRREWEDERK